MEIWNTFDTVIENGLSFTKVKKGYDTYEDTTGIIYFHDMDWNYAGYIDLYVSTCYYKHKTHLLYTSIRLDDTGSVAEFNTPMFIDSYDNVPSVNNYLFWSENSFTSESGDTNIIVKEHTEYKLREKEQVKPIDNSQDWTDTGRYRDDPTFEPIIDSCHCGAEYQWLLNGIICDGVNKCNKYKLQRKIDCDDVWEDVTPIIEKIGEVIEYDSSECGTYEYFEEWDDTPYCGYEINEKYNYNVVDTNKYVLKFAYIRKIDSDTWELVDCGVPLDYKLYYENSFECGWIGTKTETTTERICGIDAKEKYPSLANLVDTTKYDIHTNVHYETEPYPTNTDDMSEDEWVWKQTETTYTYEIVESGSCDCGYFYTQWDETDEYSCGSALGSGYTETTMYRKYINNKYCGGELIETTDEIDWRVYDSHSCECGYRMSGYTYDTEIGYEYVCGNGIEDLDENYMYYKTYYYTKCTDGSNFVFDKTKIKYQKASHSTSAVTECVFDEQTNANTTEVKTTYRTYYDQNDNKYVVVNCDGNDYVIDIVETKRSSNCGYRESWIVSGTVCCGNIDYANPIEFTIDSVEGDWTRNEFTFTSNPVFANGNAIEYIQFTLGSDGEIVLDYDISGHFNSTLGYAISDKLDKTEIYYFNQIAVEIESGQYVIKNVKKGTHLLGLRYKQSNTIEEARNNAIVKISARYESCTKYAKYNAELLHYSIDNGDTWIPFVPNEWRYGKLIEINSEECGYIPTLTQWKLLCPDVSADDYKTPEDIDECVECHTSQYAPSLFAIEYEQTSTDGGVTWKDTGRTRTEKLLKWKSPACGYEGDIYETRWTNEYCVGNNLYGTKTIWYSSDNGANWFEVEGSSSIELKEENSTECQTEEGGE